MARLGCQAFLATLNRQQDFLLGCSEEAEAATITASLFTDLKVRRLSILAKAGKAAPQIEFRDFQHCQ